MLLTRTSVLLLFAVLGSANAASSLEQLANWPGLIAQARRCGVDYRPSVARAEKGDPQALKHVFQATPCTDGAAADTHCTILRRLLEVLGDQTFSNALRTLPSDVRNRVTQAIDFDYGHPWQRRFPRTYRLGSHDTRLLRGGQDI